MTEQETAAVKEAPKLHIHDNAQIKLSASKPEPQRKKKIEVKKQSRRQQQEEKGNSTHHQLRCAPGAGRPHSAHHRAAR